MKTNIAADGKMTIKGENDLENYALNSWLRDWKEDKAVLYVEVQHDHSPNAKTHKQVKLRD